MDAPKLGARGVPLEVNQRDPGLSSTEAVDADEVRPRSSLSRCTVCGSRRIGVRSRLTIRLEEVPWHHRNHRRRFASCSQYAIKTLAVVALSVTGRFAQNVAGTCRDAADPQRALRLS